ncbi:hypothetical protein ACQ4LE_001105 [Meloidogyne hapla]
MNLSLIFVLLIIFVGQCYSRYGYSSGGGYQQPNKYIEYNQPMTPPNNYGGRQQGGWGQSNNNNGDWNQQPYNNGNDDDNQSQQQQPLPPTNNQQPQTRNSDSQFTISLPPGAPGSDGDSTSK